jgi:hypothetical protein
VDGWRLRACPYAQECTSHRCFGSKKLPRRSRGSSNGGVGPLLGSVEDPFFLLLQLITNDARGVPHLKACTLHLSVMRKRLQIPYQSQSLCASPTSTKDSSVTGPDGCRKKRPGVSRVDHLATARVGGADNQGQLPLMNTVPKPTPEVVITCTFKVPLHDSRHRLVHGTTGIA